MCLRILSFFILPVLFLGASCARTSSLAGEGSEPKKLRTLVPESAVFDDGVTGFALYDPLKKEWLYQYQADKLFTPASNTKILTLYAALRHLGDSTVFARIQRSFDTLILYPMGDPTFLNPVFPQNDKLMERLEKQTGPVIISNGHFTGKRFGRGWAWDDFVYGFQPEVSMFPIYGNLVHLHLSPTGLLNIEPGYFSSFTVIRKESRRKGSYIRRDEFSNSFEFYVGRGPLKEIFYAIPFNTYPYLIKELLEERFDFTVFNLYPDQKCIPWEKEWSSSSMDTVLRRMMYQSDNLIAEQLLLQISANELGYLNTDSIMIHLRKEVREIIPDMDSLCWVDGSGLSRYNQITPRSLVKVLERLDLEYTRDNIRAFFPAGGRQGTIREHYGGTSDPYVYAKTGSMTGVHCLSGYLTTDSGRELIFSFMHNQFFGSNTRYKEEMEKILRYIKLKF